jgi:hypothetical protein
MEVPPEPAATPPATVDSEPVPEASPVTSFTEDFDSQPEPEPASVPGTAFEVDFDPETKPGTGPFFIPEPEPEIDITPDPSPASFQEGAPVSGPILTPEPASELSSAPEPASEGQFSTETLADLYAQQGLIEKAVGMYKQILEQDPGNEAVKLKLENLAPEAQRAPVAPQETQSPAERQIEPPREADAEDTLSILEGLLENVERIKRP